MDYEKQLYSIMANVKKTFGNTRILSEYLKNIQNYYMKEYDYNKKTFEQDVTCVANELLNQSKYNKLSDVLSLEDFELVISITANEIESFCLTFNA